MKAFGRVVGWGVFVGASVGCSTVPTVTDVGDRADVSVDAATSDLGTDVSMVDQQSVDSDNDSGIDVGTPSDALDAAPDAVIEAGTGLDGMLDDVLDDVVIDRFTDAADTAFDTAPESGPRCAEDAGVPVGTRLRIAAANLTSGTLQSYEGPGIRIFQGLRPDVVMIQEFRYQLGPLRALIDTAFGTTYQFFVEQPMATGIPNGIVSRYPIIDAGEWDDPRVADRDFVWAHIDVPGTTDLWAFSVHLLRSSPDVRSTEATELLALIASTVPAGDYVVVGGDLNANTETEPVLTTFGTALVVNPPYPVDQLGNNRTSGNRTRPYDWVMARPNLAAYEVPVRVGDWCYDHGLVFDSRVFTPLSDVAPVLVDDSAALNMQHMMVVRDYVIPTP